MKHLHFLFCVAMSLCAGMAYAQTDSTQQKVQELQRVDVVAERQTDAQRATTPVQQIDRERMVRLGVHTMTDALQHLAGITVRDYGGAGGMKTVSVRGIGACHTAVVYDGVALSDCQTGEIDLSRYSLEHLASVRLVVGDDDNIFQPARNQVAAATLYLTTHSQPLSSPESLLFEGASQASNGSKGSHYSPQSQDVKASRRRDNGQWDHGELSDSFPTRAGQGRESIGGESILSVGSFGLVNPSFRLHFPTLQGGAGRRLSLTAIGEFFRADNDYPFTLHNATLTTREHRSNSRMATGRGELNADWMPGDHTQLSAKAYYYGSNRRLPGIVHLYTSENHERLVDQTGFGQLRLRTYGSSRWALLATAKYHWSHTDYANRTPGSGIGDARYWQREAYASASLLYVPARWLSLDYALDLQHNSLNSTLTLYDHHPHRTYLLQSLAAKAQWARLTLTGRTLVSLAGNPVGGGSLSSVDPSLSLSCQLLPREPFYLRLMAKRIYRLPTFNELFFYHLGASSLKPERASQFNAGLTWRHSHLALTADLYLNQVRDKIVALPYNMFVWRISNLGRATILGADVTASGRWPLTHGHVLGFDGNYSWQRAMNTTPGDTDNRHNQLPYTPQHTCCGTLSWDNPWVNIGLTGSAQSCRWTTVGHASGTRMAGFAVADLSFWRRVAWPSRRKGDGAPRELTIRLALQNLLDRQYDLVAHYPMPGRSWRLQLSLPLR